MQTIHQILTQQFFNATRQAFPDLENIFIDISQSTQEKFGHYQCNSPMKLAKSLGKPPRAIAEALVQHLDKKNIILSTEIAGPGFINIVLRPEFLAERTEILLKDSHLGIDLKSPPQRVIIDFSSPNIAKEMHVGHLRSTIIGDTLARLFEFMGDDVIRLNHVGDWGTAFGMLIAYLKEQHPEVLKGAPTTLQDLMQWYKNSKKQFDEDPEFKKRSQLQVVALQGGDQEALAAWKMICEISRISYQEIYDLLDVKLEERGESFYNPLLEGIVKELEQKGMITLSDGAKCVFLEGFVNREGDPLPLMVQKSDGGYNYDTTDMAAIKHRTSQEKGDRLIYVTDAGQSLHFQQIFAAAKKAGYLDPQRVRADHVPFGLVLGSDGKKFKTRSGETEKLIDLLNNAVEKASVILQERTPEMPKEEQQHLAKVLGIGAIKYADLSCNRVGDYHFSYDRMLRFEGNTAAFILYSYVRVAGIKRKVGVADEQALLKHPIHLSHPSEIALALQINQFGEVLETIVDDLLPHHLCEYLYNLAEKFNAFFRDCRVEGSEEQNSRLLLCEATAKTLKTGLHLLGLKTVDRM